MLNGIDVSVYQGKIDWPQVKAGGISFAFVKATEGASLTDSRFPDNVTGAFSAGLAVGVYHYLTAGSLTAAKREADFFMKTVKPYASQIDLWTAVDVEYDPALLKLDKENLTELVLTFCRTVAASGGNPCIYTNRDFLVNRLQKEKLVGIPLWQAHWANEKPNDSDNLVVWQNRVVGSENDVKRGFATVVGSVPGVQTACDCDIGYFTLPLRIKVGDRVTIRPGATYSSGFRVPDVCIGVPYTVTQVMNGDRPRALLGEIFSWVPIEYLDILPPEEIIAGDQVIIKKDARYTNGVSVPKAFIGIPYTVSRTDGTKALLSELYSWVPIGYLTKV